VGAVAAFKDDISDYRDGKDAFVQQAMTKARAKSGRSDRSRS
jgi:hypothetical protein